MTITELLESKIGTTDVHVKPNFYALRPDMAFIAVLRKRIPGGIKPMQFFGPTAEAALKKLTDAHKELNYEDQAGKLDA